MTLKRKKWWANHGATIAGALMAIGMAWQSVDWANFDLSKEWPKLVLDAMIAAGGYLTKFKVNEESPK